MGKFPRTSFLRPLRFLLVVVFFLLFPAGGSLIGRVDFIWIFLGFFFGPLWMAAARCCQSASSSNNPLRRCSDCGVDDVFLRKRSNETAAVNAEASGAEIRRIEVRQRRKSTHTRHKKKWEKNNNNNNKKQKKNEGPGTIEYEESRLEFGEIDVFFSLAGLVLFDFFLLSDSSMDGRAKKKKRNRQKLRRG